IFIAVSGTFGALISVRDAATVFQQQIKISANLVTSINEIEYRHKRVDLYFISDRCVVSALRLYETADIVHRSNRRGILTSPAHVCQFRHPGAFKIYFLLKPTTAFFG